MQRTALPQCLMCMTAALQLVPPLQAWPLNLADLTNVAGGSLTFSSTSFFVEGLIEEGPGSLLC